MKDYLSLPHTNLKMYTLYLYKIKDWYDGSKSGSGLDRVYPLAIQTDPIRPTGQVLVQAGQEPNRPRPNPRFPHRSSFGPKPYPIIIKYGSGPTKNQVKSDYRVQKMIVLDPAPFDLTRFDQEIDTILAKLTRFNSKGPKPSEPTFLVLLGALCFPTMLEKHGNQISVWYPNETHFLEVCLLAQMLVM